MARPPSKVIVAVESVMGIITQVLEVDLECLFCVVYNGKSFRMKKLSPGGQRYPKITHYNICHAMNERDRLNKLFGSTLFEVMTLEIGIVIK